MSVEPANLLFILGESHAPDLLGALGNPYIHTPNLDRLARRGTLFESAHCASPLCVPARAALASGRFPHQTGYWDSSLAFDGRFDSWMKRVREAGYHTVGIGKMHFRSDADDNGFSEFRETMHIAEGKGDLVSALRFEQAEPAYPGLWDLWTRQYGAGDADPYRQYDERIIAEATGWLRSEAARGERPWALSVHTIAAHAPFTVPREYLELYDPERIPPPVRFGGDERPRHPSIEHLRRIVCHEYGYSLQQVQQIRAAYFATVSYLDALIGRLLDTLEALGLSESTRVVYTSDHGFSCGDHYIFGLFHLLQESLGVPLIMAGPDVPEGCTSSVPVSHVDLYPTLLESCGVALDERDSDLYGD
ncbi:MAG: sulfatase-like hydrolase/transferase, partial [Gammaproteobacteria bacterium]